MDKHEPRNFLSARYRSCRVLLNVLVIAGLCAIACKAFRLQVLEHSVWVERSQAQLNTTFTVPAYRGSIYDRMGRLLSYSVPQRSLYADGRHIDNPRKVAAQLGQILGEPPAAIEKKLTASRHFVWIKRHLTDQQALAVESLKCPGLNLTDEYKRFYPYRQVGGQIVGFVGMDGNGLEGVEKSFDDVLKGAAIPVGQMRDGSRKCIWMKASAPPDPAESYGVKLSLDTFIQYHAECELEKVVQKYKAKAAEVVVMDARTSEVLAMVNWPFFDPNLPEKRDAALWRNRTIADAFEPGSTFKVFLMSAALDDNMVRERDRIYCEGGKCKLAGHLIKDVHGHGWLTMPEVIKYSSNIGAAKLALHIGGERYYRYISGFGFGSVSGIQLPGEVKGLLRHHKRWRPIDLATTGFGQSIGVTSLQLTTGVSVIANGGEFLPPTIARSILDCNGKPIRELGTTKTRRVIQKKTADQIRAMMVSVTQEGGTGVQGAPEGYTAACKTGTAQVMDPATKRYASHKYTSVFTGFVPAEQPRLVISVVVHEPQGAIYGGVVAGPVFRNIAAKALPYLGVMPSIPNPAPSIRLVNSSSAGASKKASGRQDASGKAVADSNKPKADKTVAKKKPATVITDAKKTQVSPKTSSTEQRRPETYSLRAQERASGLY
ncbi:MAG: penicillin-binding protein 2 [Desulfobacteraceae bacterium]|nr:penicillin-binding protein 2 [Desulfobacteraceae bacterium]